MDNFKKFSVSKKTYLVGKIGSCSFGNVIASKKKFYIKGKSESVKVVAEEFTGKAVMQDMISFREFSEWHKYDHPNVLSLLPRFRQP